MKTLWITREELEPRPDIGEDWYEWEGCYEEANIVLPGCNVILAEHGHINTGGESSTRAGESSIRSGQTWTRSGETST